MLIRLLDDGDFRNGHVFAFGNVRDVETDEELRLHGILRHGAVDERIQPVFADEFEAVAEIVAKLLSIFVKPTDAHLVAILMA